jgi:predicted regulator of Ras-like GTPase activity (Roadblock/LC7/MglB family)
MVKKSLGELERAILATPDGVLTAASNPSDIDDIVAALGAAVVAGVGDAFRQYLLLGVRHVTIELEDGRVAIMRDLGSAVLCLVTRPKPNLGLIYHLLGKHESGLLAALDRYYARAAEPAPIERAQAAAPRAAYRVKG